MKQFVVGLFCGLFIVVMIAATPNNQEKPCGGWKMDAIAYQTAILGLCESDYDLYQNVMNNMGFQMSLLLGTPEKKYVWEHEKLPKSEQVAFDRLRDKIMENIKKTMKVIEELENGEIIKPMNEGGVALETKQLFDENT